MRRGGIARTGEARRFGRYWFGCVKTGEQPFATRLTRNPHEGNKVIGCRAGDAARGHATIAVSIQNSAFVIDGDFVEVEQVSVLMAATLLPDAGHALNRTVWRRVDRRPGLATVISGGDEGVPFARETYRLVIARDISAQEPDGRAAGAATYRFDFSGVLDAVRCADVEIISPRDAVIWIAVTYFDARVTFRRIPRGNRLIVDIGIVNSAIRVDGDRRIGALGLRDAARDDELLPSCAPICAQCAALLAAALINRQPDGTIWSYVKVAVQTAALRRDTGVC